MQEYFEYQKYHRACAETGIFNVCLAVVGKDDFMTQKISGNLHVSNDVLADLAGTAALGCYGVVGMAAPSLQDGIARILPPTACAAALS